MRFALRLVVALGWMLAVAFLPSTAWAVDCAATPEDPACVAPSESASPSPEVTASPEPSPSVTVTQTVTAEPSPAADAPGVDTGVYVDPASGSLRVDENTGVALGVSLWLAAVVAGAATAWLVLP